MPIPRFDRTYRHFHRYQTIVNVLVKYGFGELIERLNLQRFAGARRLIERLRSPSEETEPLTFPVRFRVVLEELGPTFVKFGQILSTRPDILPPDMITELAKLRESVPPVPLAEVRGVIERELARPPESVFAEIDAQPLGSASLAQTHRATLTDGREVVVKVQRPGIETLIRTDLAILANLAGLAERTIEELRLYQPVRLVQEFAGGTLRELDFRLEAANLDRMRANFESDPFIRLPVVHWDWTTRRILTMELVKGIRIDDRPALLAAGLDPAEVAGRGARAFLTQALEHGIFHADPHPGNLFIQPDGAIVMVDVGLAGHLDEEQSAALAELIVSLVARNYSKLVANLRELGFDIPEELERPIRHDLRDLIEPLHGRSLRHLELGNLLARIVEITQRYRVIIPTDFLLLTRALVVMEGVGRQLDPDLDLVEIGRPIAAEIIRRRYDPVRLATEMAHVAADYNELLRHLPRRLQTLIERLLKDRLRLEIQHRGLESLQREIDRGTNRLALSMVVAGLVVGASIVMLSGGGGRLAGYPALGVIGYVLGALMGVWLIISILRSGRL